MDNKWLKLEREMAKESDEEDTSFTLLLGNTDDGLQWRPDGGDNKSPPAAR